MCLIYFCLHISASIYGNCQRSWNGDEGCDWGEIIIRVLTHNWEPCQAAYAATWPLLHQQHKSIALQHKQESSNGWYEIKPRYLQKTQNHAGRVGGAGQAMAEGNKNNWTPKRHVTWRPHHTLEPILPTVCEKYVFRFIRSSASGKPHLFCDNLFYDPT